MMCVESLLQNSLQVTQHGREERERERVTQECTGSGEGPECQFHLRKKWNQRRKGGSRSGVVGMSIPIALLR
jgi:hypothetical protein